MTREEFTDTEKRICAKFRESKVKTAGSFMDEDERIGGFMVRFRTE